MEAVRWLEWCVTQGTTADAVQRRLVAIAAGAPRAIAAAMRREVLELKQEGGGSVDEGTKEQVLLHGCRAIKALYSGSYSRQQCLGRFGASAVSPESDNGTQAREGSDATDKLVLSALMEAMRARRDVSAIHVSAIQEAGCGALSTFFYTAQGRDPAGCARLELGRQRGVEQLLL